MARFPFPTVTRRVLQDLILSAPLAFLLCVPLLPGQGPAFAQTSTETAEEGADGDAPPAAADPVADLKLLEDRANADLNLADAYRLMSRQLSGQRQSSEPDIEYIAGTLGLNWQISGNDPYDYSVAQRAEEARLRAQFVSQILLADLNGDWSISREEVVDSLAIGQGRSTSDLFLKGDKNRDDVLDLEEIRAVVAESVQGEGIGRGRNRSVMMAKLIDFDQDGNLSQEEVNRAWNAFRSQNP